MDQPIPTQIPTPQPAFTAIPPEGEKKGNSAIWIILVVIIIIGALAFGGLWYYTNKIQPQKQTYQSDQSQTITTTTNNTDDLKQQLNQVPTDSSLDNDFKLVDSDLKTL